MTIQPREDLRADVTAMENHAERGIAAQIRRFDIALQPAAVPYASPLKVLEYMAAGRAIVAVVATGSIIALANWGIAAAQLDRACSSASRASVKAGADCTARSKAAVASARSPRWRWSSPRL